MLKKINKEILSQNLNYFYNLALDLTKSSYPTYTDGIKTKEDFLTTIQNSLKNDTEETFIYLEQNTIKGIIQYQWIPEDKYIQTQIFNIESNLQKALKEFTEYIYNKFPGYELYMGFPEENTKAIDFLSQNNFNLIESSVNFTLDLSQYKIKETDSSIKKITASNYEDFKKVHSIKDNEMYWTSERIFKNLKNWNIFLYYKNNEPAAAICAMNCTILTEIFSVDFLNMPYNTEIEEKLLTALLNDCKTVSVKHLCYFAETESINAAINSGLKRVGKYLCYSKCIS